MLFTCGLTAALYCSICGWQYSPCSLQHSNRSQIIVALILTALKLGVIWSAEHCH